MAAIRKAQVVWEGDLGHGKGQVTAASSKSFNNLPVTWASRTESPDSKTSPEEMLAAAHASCFAMALSFALGNAGTPPQRLTVTATVTFDQAAAGFRVVSSELEVQGTVKGIDAQSFTQTANSAKENCPISQALKNNVRIELHASLTS